MFVINKNNYFFDIQCDFDPVMKSERELAEKHPPRTKAVMDSIHKNLGGTGSRRDAMLNIMDLAREIKEEG